MGDEYTQLTASQDCDALNNGVRTQQQQTAECCGSRFGKMYMGAIDLRSHES
jgi:hypothetical protein